MKIYIISLLSLFVLPKALVTASDSVSIIGFTRYDNRFILSADNTTPKNNDDITENADNSVFDIKSISSMLTKDITHPKLMNNSTDIEFSANKECSEFIKRKYKCINLQDKDFKTYCKKLDSSECGSIGERQVYDVSKLCNINMIEATDLTNTINHLIDGKQYFCLKKNINNKNISNDDNISRSTEIDVLNNKNESNSEFCPITIALQKGYLELVKEGEKQDLETKKRKRSPLISDVNSFIPSRSIDLQVIKKKLVEDLRKNCNYTFCHEKAVQFIKNIRDDYSYFGVIYKYRVNDDTLENSILNILNSKNCTGTISGIIPKYVVKNQILITIAITFLLLFKIY